MKSHLSILLKYACIGFVASIVFSLLDHDRLPSWLFAAVGFVVLSICLNAYRK